MVDRTAGQHPSDADDGGGDTPWRPAVEWTPAPGTQDLFLVPLDAGGGGSATSDRIEDHRRAGILNDAELRRGERLLLPDKRRQFLVTRTVVRRVLGFLLGRAPRSVPLVSGPHGKPALADGPSFNASHSGTLAVVVVSADAGVRLGVDVEEVRSGRPLRRLASRFFSSAEHERHLLLEASLRTDDFYRRWALKEAYVKALGTGLTYSSRAFTLADDEVCWRARPLVEECRRCAGEEGRWSFRNGWIEHGTGRWAVATCADREGHLRRYRWQWKVGSQTERSSRGEGDPTTAGEG